MTDITKLAQEIRHAAVKIGVEIWRAEGGSVITSDYLVDGVTCCDHVADFETVNGVSNYAEFVAAANPASVLVILYALEKEKERAEAAEKRVAELEARTLTIELPDRRSERFWSDDASEFDILGFEFAIVEVLRAAGIGIKGE